MSVLLCRCAQANVLPKDTVDAVRQWLREAGVEVCEVGDLCALAGQREPGLQAFAGKETTIMACHPRAVRWLFAAAGAPLAEGAGIVNLRIGGMEEIKTQLTKMVGKESQRPPVAATREGLESLPCREGWFPVIDFSRCTQCLQCLSFCLFDVYAVDVENHVRVERPANCKAGCPACAGVPRDRDLHVRDGARDGTDGDG